MEPSKKTPPLVTLDDVKDILVEATATTMDVFAAIAAVAKTKFDQLQNTLPTSTATVLVKSPEVPDVQLPQQDRKLPTPETTNNTVKVHVSSPEQDVQLPIPEKTNNYPKIITQKAKKRQRISNDDEDDEEVENYRPVKKNETCNSNNTKYNSKKRKRGIVYSEPVNREIPEEFKRLIMEVKGGSDLRLVIQKKLTETDINKGHNRFLMPFKRLLNRFLLDEEDDFLNGFDQREKSKAMEVDLIEPNLDEIRINLKRWEMEKAKAAGKPTKFYVLNKTWFEAVSKNELGVESTVQLWSFRVNRRLWFALVDVSVGESTPSSTPSSNPGSNSASHSDED